LYFIEFFLPIGFTSNLHLNEEGFSLGHIRSSNVQTSPIAASLRGGSLKETKSVPQNIITAQDKNQTYATISQQLGNICLSVILQCIIGHRKNQLQTAERFPVILTRLKGAHYFLACISLLFFGNKIVN